MATGGLTKGKSHAEGGIPMTVKDTGQNIEVEGGEIIINKKSVADPQKHSFDGEKLTIKNYFYFFHITDVEEQFDKLLIEGDIKAINDYLFLNLYIIKFFRTVRHDEDDIRKSVDKLKEYIKEQQIKREMIYNN